MQLPRLHGNDDLAISLRAVVEIQPAVKAWTIHRGDKAPAAAGVIDSDFEKGFIRAETVGYQDSVRLGGWKGAREQGLARAEGKEYVVQDGDVILFRFNV